MWGVKKANNSKTWTLCISQTTTNTMNYAQRQHFSNVKYLLSEILIIVIDHKLSLGSKIIWNAIYGTWHYLSSAFNSFKYKF